LSQSEYPYVYLAGAGRMGGALLRGWLATGFPPDRLVVKDPQPSLEMSMLLQEQGIRRTADSPPDVLVLAVKPQMMEAALQEIAPLAGPDTVVLSIAAGRTIASIARPFPLATPIVRSMPNLPAEIGRGITALYPNAHVTSAQRGICESLLCPVGELAWVGSEELIDVITAVSGSGPAYVFYLAECLAEAGRVAGLPEDIAMQFARAAVTGSGEMLHSSPLEAAQLRENVTSPGGTTAAGLSILMAQPGLKDLIIKTVAAAARRSRELSE
jgi:pyrroline-5-carboxylate reductase